eukprot:505592_1
MYALATGPPCAGTIGDTDIACWQDDTINTIFIISWSIATITLWLRIINFVILSHKLGPMVQMIFNMMGDVVRFFSIMGILFFAFTMCLMFIMGDVYPEFHNPITAGITLFRALLGDLDFEATIKEDDETTNEALIYWGFFLMLLYLVIGSLVLLNLLVAIMAKTFDTIEETTRQSITFAKFKLAMNKDRTASFMPPPYNVIAFALIVLFYAIEYCINIVKRLLYCCRKNKKFIRFDLAVRLMPPFMRRRQLELDEQIVFENCQRRWIITTNKGTKWGKFVKYEAEIMHHYVQFTDEVSVQNSVLKKKEWKLDAFDLYREGLLDMKQFEINVTEKYTNEAHESMKSQWCKSNDQKRQSQYWICGFCRGYVKASKISTKKLAFMLRVHPMEMKIVNQLSPEICMQCYVCNLIISHTHPILSYHITLNWGGF